ncbi:hypothetical protein D3C71_24440 [compost metagenome]
MHRQPQLKDQAAILRQAHQAKGVPLSAAESLDLAARLNGYADWNAAAAAEKLARKSARNAAPLNQRSGTFALSLTTWTVVHRHRHGEATFLVHRDQAVSMEEAIAIVNSEDGGYEPEHGETIEVLGPSVQSLEVAFNRLTPKATAAAVPQPLASVAGTASPVLEVNMLDLFDYDDPEKLPEWQWIGAQRCFEHVENGVEGGIWEQMVLVAKGLQDASLPAALKPSFLKAQALGCKWVLFYQG